MKGGAMFLAQPYQFARPNDTTAYTAGDLVANNTTAGLVVPPTWGVERLDGEGRITALRFHSKSNVVLAATFDVHFFGRLPVFTNGDNGAFVVSTAEFYLGTISCDLSTLAFVTATEKTKRFIAAGNGIVFDLPSVAGQAQPPGFLYAAIVATGGYVPVANEVFILTPELEY